ncbi:DNA-binding IclR family transcriptional regulator [Allostreptomyces psammosilenae]|uniref:DNA-binding IclR family transcriptional regulator n=1 Tax=Allostreptomyces psammosilenae TaxID=1892865 RepID=A0A852ZWB4_9ACTN|nr:DNA-binding IclR family transcriptional regulator [Allostreptomyces psammosilenae]
MRLLKLLADSSQGLTVTEMAGRLEVNRTVVYRLLTTLEQHALVRRDIQGRARIAPGVLHLAYQVHPLLRDVAGPALRRLADDLGSTAHLTLAEGSDAIVVAVAEPTWTDYHVAYRVGMRHPLERGAAGRAILAQRAGELPRTGPRYVRVSDDCRGGTPGVASPLRGFPGMEGSVGVLLLEDVADEGVGDRVVQAADEIAELMR